MPASSVMVHAAPTFVSIPVAPPSSSKGIVPVKPPPSARVAVSDRLNDEAAAAPIFWPSVGVIHVNVSPRSAHVPPLWLATHSCHPLQFAVHTCVATLTLSLAAGQPAPSANVPVMFGIVKSPVNSPGPDKPSEAGGITPAAAIAGTDAPPHAPPSQSFTVAFTRTAEPPATTAPAIGVTIFTVNGTHAAAAPGRHVNPASHPVVSHVIAVPPPPPVEPPPPPEPASSVGAMAGEHETTTATSDHHHRTGTNIRQT
jgi:hypothetical protein